MTTVTHLDLINASMRFQTRTDSFAAGKADICRDLASKLLRFGRFASDKQAEFAAKLVSWSMPRPAADTRPEAEGIAVPNLYAVLLKHSTFHVDRLAISRKNQDSLCWLKLEGHDGVIGILDRGIAKLTRKGAQAVVDAGLSADWLPTLLRELDADPLTAAKKYGKLSGRCCSCGRDLTDPDSIEAGIGPICAGKFGG